ncbi:complexin-1 [Pyrgilauda ruficollis]|uniref:complexin-1 n=1 Tax=Pyrgilauda ruficollis TaxID=221976 RepID=UPI001B88551B|nr:complexin-1 [Pyrgilauda ruficollis]
MGWGTRMQAHAPHRGVRGAPPACSAASTEGRGRRREGAGEPEAGGGRESGSRNEGRRKEGPCRWDGRSCGLIPSPRLRARNFPGNLRAHGRRPEPVGDERSRSSRHLPQPPAPARPVSAQRLSPSEAAFQGFPVSVHVRCEGGQDPKQQIMDFVMKQALGGATKDMGKMLGGDEEKDPDAAKKEEERQEALRQQEEERKAKYAKMEAEREVMRQGIRDKGAGKLDQQQSDVEQEGKMQSPAHGKEKNSHTVGDKQLDCSTAQKDLGVLVDSKLTMSLQGTLRVAQGEKLPAG